MIAASTGVISAEVERSGQIWDDERVKLSGLEDRLDVRVQGEGRVKDEVQPCSLGDWVGRWWCHWLRWGNEKGRMDLGEDHRFSYGSDVLDLKYLRDVQVEMWSDPLIYGAQTPFPFLIKQSIPLALILFLNRPNFLQPQDHGIAVPFAQNTSPETAT